jgi:hypothetical protein
MQIRLYWIPGHSGNAGNEIASQLAKQAATSQEDHGFRRLGSVFRRTVRKNIEEWQRGWTATQKGKHPQQIDGGLPAKRSLRVYGSPSRHQAYLLVQLRTGHFWLASHARGFTDNDRCVCRAMETVVHCDGGLSKAARGQTTTTEQGR